MVRGWVWRAALGVAVVLTGCATNAREGRVAGSFSARTGCALSEIKVTHESGGMVAHGCGQSTRYDCFAEGCQPAEEIAAPPTADRPAERRRVTELRVLLVLEGGDGLFITATPQESEEAQMVLDTYIHRGCQLELMVDGQLLELKEGAVKSSRLLPRDVVLDLASARQVGVRACERRWSLGAQDIVQLRRFGRRYAEELAWQGTPRNQSSGGRTPPLGGWQPWRGLDAFPSATPASATLSGTQLFETLAPSVWRVEGKLEVSPRARPSR